MTACFINNLQVFMFTCIRTVCNLIPKFLTAMSFINSNNEFWLKHCCKCSYTLEWRVSLYHSTLFHVLVTGESHRSSLATILKTDVCNKCRYLFDLYIRPFTCSWGNYSKSKDNTGHLDNSEQTNTTNQY